MRSVALALSLLSLAHAAMTDPATGIAFKPRINELSIFGVGVRKKGPIKVRTNLERKRDVFAAIRSTAYLTPPHRSVPCRYTR